MYFKQYIRDLLTALKLNSVSSFTSIIITSGLREVIRYLVKNKMVDCIVTTAGGIEENFIKCLAPTVIGAFNINGHDLFQRSVYRAGNMLLPCKSYSLFEHWIVPILDQECLFSFSQFFLHEEKT